MMRPVKSDLLGDYIAKGLASKLPEFTFDAKKFQPTKRAPIFDNLQNDELNELVTRQEIARRLKVSVSSVVGWDRDKIIKRAISRGYVIRYRWGSVLEGLRGK